ncbi:unnamed protein product [Arabis nemorensis]|uniref:Uncharacterized protein n=1 Tax=Arabis nemorensis TaxID=586526 RepID=A0A565BUW8_9BRAS|nr:unnamed protein product [Arabis nemorensis]
MTSSIQIDSSGKSSSNRDPISSSSASTSHDLALLEAATMAEVHRKGKARVSSGDDAESNLLKAHRGTDVLLGSELPKPQAPSPWCSA